MPEIVAMLC